MWGEKKGLFLLGGFISLVILGYGLYDYIFQPKTISLVNVSYDSTRELYSDYDKAFQKYWKTKTGQSIQFVLSNGGSGAQTRSVLEGLDADVVTLALASDIHRLVKAGLVSKNWEQVFPDQAAPYTSTIVMLVRKGNPKGIHDWNDLADKSVTIVMPNPKTSGGARWNYMALWSYGDIRFQGNQEKIEDFIKKVLAHVISLDTGSRSATTTFVERKQGDVLITWESEALEAKKQKPKDLEIIRPSISILAQPPVAVVTAIAQKKGTEKEAQAYLSYLYSKEGQNIIAQHFFRPVDANILESYKMQFPPMSLIPISRYGGWATVTDKQFKDGGLFDQLYEQVKGGDTL